MIKFNGRCILLDIEGTTSSISFVYDVMFPFIRRELSSFLEQSWKSDDVQSACDRLAADAGFPSLKEWSEESPGVSPAHLVQHEIIRLMDDDVKSTGLKQMQGLIWKSGFHSGELEAHLFDDVADAIRAWNAAGVSVRIYSSGSIAAQKLFFGHTVAGDLLELLDAHYDTTTGPKKEVDSYDKIAEDSGFSADQILFLSDVPAELDAAKSAGMQTGLCIRPGNKEAEHAHDPVHDFGEIELP